MSGTLSLPQEKGAPPYVGAPGVIEVWDIERLRPNPLNPRGELDPEDIHIKDLAASIAEKGVLEPILVTPEGWVVAGHRRRLACTVAGVSRVRVIVRRLSEQEQLEVMLIENIQREDLNPLQEARGYKSLLERDVTLADITRSSGIPYHRIASHLTLLDFPAEVQQLFASGSIAMGAAKILAQLDSRDEQVYWARRAAMGNWSVRVLAGCIGGKKKKGAERSIRNAITGPVITRELAVGSLSRSKAWPLTFEVLSNALDRTGCACTLVEDKSQHEKMCIDCPLSQFLAAVLQEVHDASS